MKKAFTTLDALNIDNNVEYDFHDYKKQSIDKDSVQRWVTALGIDKVLNKRGTTWRKLSDEQKLAADDNVDQAIDLLINNTSMIKRPIIEGKFKNSGQDSAILLYGYDEEALNTAFK